LVLVSVLDCANPPLPQITLLQRLFDLSPAEARVAQQMVTGRTLQDIAQSLGIAAQTVRNHLAVVYRKVGVKGHAQLVARLAQTLVLADGI
jgi:DNA-binding CsgD family transcriptional regulator